MKMETKVLPMRDFMGRFADQFFERAKAFMDPEYERGHERHKPIVKRLAELNMLRRPFPAQAEIIHAGATHLYQENKPALILSQDMGTGKTLVGSTLAMMGNRPQRTIVVVPPHLVAKWARELEVTFPGIVVHRINHAGANEIIEREFKKNPGAPKCPEFWIIGRVRMRMSFRYQPATNLRYMHAHRLRAYHHCPDCGRPILEPIQPSDKDDGAESMDTVSFMADDGNEDSGSFAYASTEWVEKKRRTCAWVLNADEKVVTGCGQPLWQAVRHHHKSPMETLSSALMNIPSVGQKIVGRLLSLDEHLMGEILHDLSNGTIHSAFMGMLGKVGRKKAQRYLDSSGFTIGDGNYAPVEFIKRQVKKGWFDVAIFDEMHELKGDNTAQGIAFGILSSCVKKTIGLSGTLVDGYAASLHPLLFRCDPKALINMGYDANDGARFQREMGVIRDIVTEVEEDSKLSARSRKKVYRQTRNLPGLHPQVVSHLLLPNALFLDLPDVEKSIQDIAVQNGYGKVRLLPSYREVFVRIKQTFEQHTLVSEFCEDIIGEMVLAMREGGGKHLLGPVMSAALHAADGAFRDVVCHPKYYEKPIATLRPVPADKDGLLEKERFMLDLVRREVASGRKVLIYTIYTDRLDLTGRDKAILQQAGFDARVLKSSVNTELREQWVQDALEDGCQVLICNPSLVKTGLDLFEFTTILFMQTGYSTDTVQQASRRSWRIGQEQPVRIYFASYDQTPQMSAMQLMAKKIRVANQAAGNISDTGLNASLETEDDDSGALMQIANQFLDGIRDRSHDAITGAIACLDEDVFDGEFTATPMSRLQEILSAHARNSFPAQPTQQKPAVEEVPTMLVSDDFTDGLLTMIFRDASASQSPVRMEREYPKRQAPKTNAKPATGQRIPPKMQQEFLDLFA